MVGEVFTGAGRPAQSKVTVRQRDVVWGTTSLSPRGFVVSCGRSGLMTRVLRARVGDENSETTTVSPSGVTTLALRPAQLTVTFHAPAGEMTINYVLWFKPTMVVCTFSVRSIVRPRTKCYMDSLLRMSGAGLPISSKQFQEHSLEAATHVRAGNGPGGSACVA